MDKNFTCFFTGHREIPENEYENMFRKVCDNIALLYKHGYRDFITGGAIGFDTLAANAVIEMRKTLDIKLHIFIPCREQAKYFTEQQKNEYNLILASADSAPVLSERYLRGCMHNRNRKMADSSSVCIAYCTKDTGGTAYTVKYAEKKDLKIIYI